MGSHFFAMMSRMKFIKRWSLMRNSQSENICEHSLEVAMIAHALAVISNKRLGNHLDEKKAALMGMYHDSTEIITGDMPTPIKYFNPEIRGAFKEVEKVAANKLVSMLPEDLKPSYEDLFFKQEADRELWILVKAADKLSALIKCIEEAKAGNKEFVQAEQTLRNTIKEMNRKEIDIFFEEFLPSFEKTLDELN